MLGAPLFFLRQGQRLGVLNNGHEAWNHVVVVVVEVTVLGGRRFSASGVMLTEGQSLTEAVPTNFAWKKHITELDFKGPLKSKAVWPSVKILDFHSISTKIMVNNKILCRKKTLLISFYSCASKSKVLTLPTVYFICLRAIIHYVFLVLVLGFLHQFLGFFLVFSCFFLPSVNKFFRGTISI